MRRPQSRHGARRSTTRTLLSLLVAVAIALAASFAAATPAVAGATPVAAGAMHVLVSDDGIRFGATLDRPLFASAAALVPREQEVRRLWVRNSSAVDAQVRIAARDVAVSDGSVGDALTITVRDGSGPLSSFAVGELSRCTVVMPSRRLAPGATISLEISIRMQDVPAQIAQEERMSLSLRIDARGATAGPLPDDACLPIDVPGGGGTVPVVGEAPAQPHPLATTGGDDPRQWLILGATLLAAGAMIGVAHRRRAPRSEPETTRDDRDAGS